MISKVLLTGEHNIVVRYNITLAGGSEEAQRRAGECERLQAVCSVECGVYHYRPVAK